MSDVVAVGLITAGASVLSAGIGALTTYKVTDRNARTTIATAQRHSDVELERIKAENERLREQHREAERRNRQGTYHRVLAVIYRLAHLDPAGQTSKGEADALLAEWRFAASGVQLFGSREVIAKLDAISIVINEGAAPDFKAKVLDSALPLIEAMRADVLEHPDI